MLVTVAWVLGVLAWVVVLYDAFKRGTGEGLLCLIIPFYALFYVFFRAERYKGLALLLLFSSAGLGVAGRMGLFGGNDPCKLITKADVEEALWQKMDGPERSSSPRGDCSPSAQVRQFGTGS